MSVNKLEARVIPIADLGLALEPIMVQLWPKIQLWPTVLHKKLRLTVLLRVGVLVMVVNTANFLIMDNGVPYSRKELWIPGNSMITKICLGRETLAVFE